MTATAAIDLLSENDEGAPPAGGAPSSSPTKRSLLAKVLAVMNAMGSVWIFALMILICLDVGGRTWFAAPINGVLEIIELSLVGIVFMQLGDATRHGRLTRSDGFFNLVMARSPATARLIGVVFMILSVIFMGLVLWGSVPLLVEAWVENHYTGEEGLFTAPMWPVRLIVVIGCVVTMLQFAAFAIQYWRTGNARIG